MREGTLFEFASPEELLRAIEEVQAMGLRRLDTYTPYIVPELDEKLGIRRTRIPWAVLVAGVLGCALAFGIIWGTNAYDYPLNVGGRPMNSVPADVPILFETTVLLGSFTAFALVFLRSGLPRLHHPIFSVEGIQSVSIDRFWLGIDRAEPVGEAVQQRMRDLGALRVEVVRDLP